MAIVHGMGLSHSKLPLRVAPLRPGEELAWAEFLAASENGTLFHDLQFLAYHPTGRFVFHHLIVRRGNEILALLPGGLSGEPDRPIFNSPLGASFGGPIVAAGLRTGQALALIEAIQDYVRAQDWGGIEVTLAPPFYQGRQNQLMEFALFRCGFRQKHRWLCHVVPLDSGAGERYERLFRASYIGNVQRARRNGITTVDCGLDGLDAFRSVFKDTYARHGVAPTHTSEEIANLLRRLPDRVRLHLAMMAGVPLAGLLILLLNNRVAYSYYICSSTEHRREHGNVVAFAALIDRLAEHGYRYLDLGPSAWDGNFNAGVTFFKEGLGAIGHCRDRWFWPAT